MKERNIDLAAADGAAHHSRMDIVQDHLQPAPPPDALAAPVFLLSPPLSLASLACAMLGQHPQIFSLPETHLFLAETLGEWWEICAGSSFNMAHGLLRAVSHLHYGGQTEDNIVRAGAWLLRRLPFTTGFIIELIMEKVRPRLIVEKSASLVVHLDAMQRALRMFPDAKFIHLLQHPHTHGEAVVAAIQEARAHQAPVPRWLRQLACYSAAEADEHSQEHAELDPQQAWRALHGNIGEFLESVPEAQKLLVRAEDLLAGPDAALSGIVEWLGLRSDAETLEAMKHPERSPFACFGPPGARFGDNPQFLRSPTLPAAPAEPAPLDAPLSWREDGEGLSPAVQALARQFGYA